MSTKKPIYNMQKTISNKPGESVNSLATYGLTFVLFLTVIIDLNNASESLSLLCVLKTWIWAIRLKNIYGFLFLLSVLDNE